MARLLGGLSRELLPFRFRFRFRATRQRGLVLVRG